MLARGRVEALGEIMEGLREPNSRLSKFLRRSDRKLYKFMFKKLGSMYRQRRLAEETKET